MYALANANASRGLQCAQDAAVLVEICLTLEQRFSLRRLYDSLDGFSIEELKELVIETTEEKMLERGYFLSLMHMAGVEFEESEPFEPNVPQTEEEMIAIFGGPPSDEQLSNYINEQIERHMEAARMDVDIEAIALGPEE